MLQAQAPVAMILINSTIIEARQEVTSSKYDLTFRLSTLQSQVHLIDTMLFTPAMNPPLPWSSHSFE